MSWPPVTGLVAQPPANASPAVRIVATRCFDSRWRRGGMRGSRRESPQSRVRPSTAHDPLHLAAASDQSRPPRPEPHTRALRAPTDPKTNTSTGPAPPPPAVFYLLSSCCSQSSPLLPRGASGRDLV